AGGDRAARRLRRQQHLFLDPPGDGGFGQVVDQPRAGLGHLGAAPHHQRIAVLADRVEEIAGRLVDRLPLQLRRRAAATAAGDVDRGHEVVRRLDREAHRLGHARAADLVLSDQRRLVVDRLAAAVVWPQRVLAAGGEGFRRRLPSLRHRTADVGLAVLHADADLARLALAHAVAATPIDEDARGAVAAIGNAAVDAAAALV